MNIHDYQRYGPRPIGYKPRNTAKAPRQRDNLTSQGCSSKRAMTVRLNREKDFAGGKRLRKASGRLYARLDVYSPTSKPSGHGNTRPGTMKA